MKVPTPFTDPNAIASAYLTITTNSGKTIELHLVTDEDLPLEGLVRLEAEVVEVPAEEHGLPWVVRRGGRKTARIELFGLVKDVEKLPPVDF